MKLKRWGSSEKRRTTSNIPIFFILFCTGEAITSSSAITDGTRRDGTINIFMISNFFSVSSVLFCFEHFFFFLDVSVDYLPACLP